MAHALDPGLRGVEKSLHPEGTAQDRIQARGASSQGRETKPLLTLMVSTIHECERTGSQNADYIQYYGC